MTETFGRVNRKLKDPQAIFEIETYCMPNNNYDLNPLPICRLLI